MSEVMLHGVLNMPIDLWRDDELDKVQRHSRYVEASETIRQQQATIERLTEQLKDMVETYQYEASSENPTLLATKALIAEIEAGNDSKSAY